MTRIEFHNRATVIYLDEKDTGVSSIISDAAAQVAERLKPEDEWKGKVEVRDTGVFFELGTGKGVKRWFHVTNRGDQELAA
ncbi:hypothetical protein ACFU44_00775 [Nocardia rhizosphaerihabitans]|uniref:hypothetical protein n=1 Tax=Nocardia rhizosphaerihabitans TaxID=1691570 RepID=UPI00367202B4